MLSIPPDGFVSQCMILAVSAAAFFTFGPAASAQGFAGSRMSTGGLMRPFYTAQPLRVYSVATLSQAPMPPGRRPDFSEEENPQAAQSESGGARPTVPGSRAVMRRGVAYAPANAPENVKRVIWAVNSIRNRPYKWGGGHGSFSDSGYDCSGTVSFALHNAGLLSAPLPSGEFLRYGERGRGRWITVYARNGHTFANVAGLRLDTTDFRFGGDVGPRWHMDGRDTWGFQARHPAGL